MQRMRPVGMRGGHIAPIAKASHDDVKRRAREAIDLLLNSTIGIKPTLVPFTGTAPVLNAMLSGEIEYECDPVLGTLPQVQPGAVRALAIAAKQRSPMPNVSTSYEQGLGEFDIAVKYAVFAPAGTPKPVIDSPPGQKAAD